MTSSQKRGSAAKPLWLWANRLAGPAKTSLGWLGAFISFSPFDAFVARPPSEFMAYKDTSFATLAGGLACFWAVLALAPCISFGAWAHARLLLTRDAGNATAMPFELESDAFLGWSWAWESLMAWVWLGVLVALLLLGVGILECAFHPGSRLQRALPKKCSLDALLGDALLGEALLRILCLYALPILFFFVFLAAQSTEGKRLVAIAYAAAFEIIATLQIDWDGLLSPSFACLRC